ncbi:tetratricopeptide repeat protein [Glycomyces tritici]|uniref:Tetratricopeptide repeat protein n=1 Tax=Glycomyces tritici TaxID=2665176 RepID=A0ABT7YM30_9ACTN|nr:tetratricopeptide repeat protein [Glycomyces tritici]MDN3239697.1 tetratricopeptide repeat protein [Glycomyces tritici]
MPDRTLDDSTGLRALRLRAMMTQEELASKAAVGVRTIRDIESGRVRPQPRTLRLLIEALTPDERGGTALAGISSSIAAAPRELPRLPAGLPGREAQLDAIIDAVGDGAAIVAVHGMAGVGKTSLAVGAAHALASKYPDGQVFVDLHGFADSAGPRPDPASVLTRVLGRLGVDERHLPTDLGELAACYRSAIADRRVLLVFDNATGAEQLESLMPGTSASLVLTTSRRDLSRLASAHVVLLEPPSIREAVAMLGTGAGRITDDEAVAIAERCGRLPLALGLAAARLRSRPHWRAEDLLARLDPENRLLDELDMGHGGVTAALRASYLELDPAHQRLLRRLSLVPGDDVDAYAAAALCEHDDAAAMLESLVDVHLAESRSPGRYRLHDLVRLFATKLAELEETREDLDGAFTRLLAVYLHCSYQAAIQVPSQHQRMLTIEATKHDIGLRTFTGQEDAVAWFQSERGNLAAAVFEAERTGHLESAWHLANAFSAFRMYERGIDQHLTVNRVALDIARRLEDEQKEAHSLADRGRHLMYASRHREAISCLENVAALNRKLGDNGGAALALRSIGVQHEQSGRFTEALDVYRSALALAEADADDGTRAIVHINVNTVFPLLRLGRLADAERHLDAAERRLEPADGYNRIRVEFYRGNFVREHGDPAEALQMHTACLERCREAGLLGGFTGTLIEVGEDLLRLDRAAEAVTYFSRAVEQAEEMAYLAFERMARNGLGRALTASGGADEAIRQHTLAAALAESHEDVYELARAHHGLADAHRRRGEMPVAAGHLRRAVKGFEDCDVPEAAAAAAELEDIEQRRSSPSSAEG